VATARPVTKEAADALTAAPAPPAAHQNAPT
jgi:hypothetical protein